MAKYVKSCAWCGKQFESTRSDALYCGATCRQRHHRKTSTSAYLMPDPVDLDYERRPLSEAEVGDIVIAIRQLASALSAASVTGPVDLRPLCRRLSHGIVGVLEVEGL